MMPFDNSFQRANTMTDSARPRFPINILFTDWLDAEEGRANYFSRVDPRLTPPIISKMRHGRYEITFEYAMRLERAQKPSDSPLRAEDLVTTPEARSIVRYVRGIEAAPEPKPLKRPKNKPSANPSPNPSGNASARV